MNINLQPESLSLAGNLRHLIVNTDEDVSFAVRIQGAAEDLVQRVYSPNAQNLMEVDLYDIVFPQLTFHLQNISTPYQQADIVKTFVITLKGVTSGETRTVTFTALRAGVDRLADTAQNFLTNNFLTWQPNIKPVTYYSPEFLTYYATVAATVKCEVHFAASSSLPTQSLTLATIPAGQAYTIPVGYAVIAGKVNELPSYYDVWVENGSGQRLTYIQRYYANNMRSEQEQWILFENSLGGIDTFRAYGSLDLDAQHNHNLVEIEEVSQEYRVDTERKYKKNTGRLDKKERLWLLDFFPSLRKYVYLDDYIRQIVVTESDVNYKAQELPSQYTFTYRFADAKPYLNLPRTDQPTGIVDIEVPDVGSFTIAPRLVEFPRLQLSSGALFPVQDPYSEDWNATTLGAVFAYFIEQILVQYDGQGGIGHMHPNLDFLNSLSWDNILRKDVADAAKKVITFLEGILLGENGYGITAEGDAILNTIRSLVYNPLSKGFAIERDEDDKYILTIDLAYIREALETDHLSTDTASISTVTSEISFQRLATFLSGIITNLMRSSDYQPGTAGFSIHRQDNGRYMMQIEDLVVLGKMLINELRVDRITYSTGNRRLTAASMVVAEVKPVYRNTEGEYVTDQSQDAGDGVVAYRCYEVAEQNGEATVNSWHVGDQAHCQTFNLDKALQESFTRLKLNGKFARFFGSMLGIGTKVWKNVTNRLYWRLVVNVGTEALSDGKRYHYIDLSDEDFVGLMDEDTGIMKSCVGKMTTLDDWARIAFTEEELPERLAQLNDLPATGDHIVQEGSQTDSQRQHMISLTVVGPYGPGIEEFMGIGSTVDKDGHECSPFTLNGHRFTALCPMSGDVFYAKEFHIETYDGTFYRIPVDRGDYDERTKFYYYDRVSYTAADGSTSLWLHIGKDMTQGVAPGTDPTVWQLSVKGSKGEKGDTGPQGNTGPQGPQGNPGADAYTIVATPSVLIFNQPIGGGAVDTDDQIVSIQVWHGPDLLPNNGYSLVNITGDNCVAGYDQSKKQLWVNSLTSGKPQTGSVTANIMVDNANVGKVVIRFGVNYLDDAYSEIKNGVITDVARSFYYVNNNGELTPCENLAQVQQSSREIHQRVSETEGGVEKNASDIKQLSDRITLQVKSSERTDNFLNNGDFSKGGLFWQYDNAYNLVRVGSNYIEGSGFLLGMSAFNSCHLVSILGTMALYFNGGTARQLVSSFAKTPSAGIPVVLSFSYHSHGTNTIAIEYRSVTTSGSTETITTVSKVTATLNDVGDGFFTSTLDAWDASITELRISGQDFAVWNVRLTQDVSASIAKLDIKADNIDLGIRNALGTVGINIKGDNREIRLIADKVKFTNAAGNIDNKISINPETGALDAVDGNFSGTVRAAVWYMPYQDAEVGKVIDPTKGAAIGIPYSSIGQNIYLPLAANYPFLVLTFYKYFDAAELQTIARISASGNEEIYTNTSLLNNYHYHTYCKSFYPPANHVIRLYAIDGHWCLDCDESKVLAFYDDNGNIMTKSNS